MLQPPPVGRARQLLAVAAVASVASAAGVAAALWGWSHHTQRQHSLAAQAAASAAEAQRATPQGRQRAAIERILNDPASAQFRNEARSTRDAQAWCGEINARNRMGGMAGFSRYAVRLPDDPTLDAFSAEIYLEPGSRDSPEHARWQASYDGYCSP